MKTYSLFIATFAFLLLLGCQNETQQASEELLKESNEIVVVDSSPSVDTVDEMSNNTNVEVAEVEKPETVANKTEKPETKLEKNSSSPKEENDEIVETAEDLSGELNNEVNRQANPDNYNGVAEIDAKSSVKLVPVFSEKDLNSYYVQIAIKVHKMSKSELAQLFPSSETVYVIQNEGLYKYCLGKFEAEADALSYKKDIDKKYDFKDSQVVTFKQAW